MLTWPSADSYRPKASEEERGEPQRFKFLCQDIGDTATQELTCQPILSRPYSVRLFSLVPLVWNKKLQGGWYKTQPPAHRGI